MLKLNKTTTQPNYGFTIIELVLVVAITGILSTIGIVSYSSVQTEARDSERASKINIIAEALEQYYMKNGEYPGCTALTQSASTVSTTTLPGLDSKNLTAPSDSLGTNSITCTDIENLALDKFSYIGDAGCLAGSICTQYTLKYNEETTGETVSLNSRHQVASTTATTPIASATVNSNTQITLSWNSQAMATSYTAERSTSSSFTSPTTYTGITTTTKAFTSLTPGTTYYLRVKTIAGASESGWSTTVSKTTTISAPAAPSVTAVISGTNAVGTTGAVTCATGTTTQYQTQNSINDGTWTAWTAWSSTAPVTTLAATQGYKYEFGSHARCHGTNADSASTSTTIGSVIRPVSAPNAPSVTAVISGETVVATVASVTCATGTTTEYRFEHTANETTTDPWTSWSTTRTLTKTAYQGSQHLFYAEAHCKGTYATSATASPTMNVTIRRPINTPAGPTYTGPSSHTRAVYYYITFSYSCPTGTTIDSIPYPGAGYFSAIDYYTGDTHPPQPFGKSTAWWIPSGNYVAYYGQYRCKTPYETSSYSVTTRSNNIYVY